MSNKNDAKFKKATPYIIGGIIGVVALGMGIFVTRARLKAKGRLPVISSPTSHLSVSVSAPVAPKTAPTTKEGELKQIAMKELGLSEDSLTVRSLRPEDLGVTGAWSFSIGTANAWNNIISTSLGDNRYLMITGLTYTGNSITQVRIVAGGRTSEIWSIEHIPSMENPVFIDLTPTMIKQNQRISIDVYSSASGTESLVFQGVVVEKSGLVLA